jgi:hypothetical protein
LLSASASLLGGPSKKVIKKSKSQLIALSYIEKSSE